MKPIPGTLQEGGAAFLTTHWTLVLRARQTQSEISAQKALSNFCEAYWPPLYSFLRHRGHASPEAQDLVQGFFAHLLEQNTLSRADQEKGRLRTFLLGSLQNFLFNEYDRAHAVKRGGGKQSGMARGAAAVRCWRRQDAAESRRSRGQTWSSDSDTAHLALASASALS